MAATAKKFEVATTHQVQAGTDQPDCSVPEVVCFPGGIRRHAVFAKQPLRNHAIGFARKVCIKRAEDERKSPAAYEKQLAEERAPAN